MRSSKGNEFTNSSDSNSPQTHEVIKENYRSSERHSPVTLADNCRCLAFAPGNYSGWTESHEESLLMSPVGPLVNFGWTESNVPKNVEPPDNLHWRTTTSQIASDPYEIYIL